MDYTQPLPLIDISISTIEEQQNKWKNAGLYISPNTGPLLVIRDFNTAICIQL